MSDDPNETAMSDAAIDALAQPPSPAPAVEPAVVSTEPSETAQVQPADVGAESVAEAVTDVLENDDSAIDAWTGGGDDAEAAVPAPAADDAAVDAWLPECEATSSPSEHPISPPTAPSDASIDGAVDAAAEKAEDTDHKLKHISTVSFTRTVTNDVNWDVEDSETDMSITRSDTDPFKHMSPTDRTNSFPPVPPLEAQHATDEGHDAHENAELQSPAPEPEPAQVPAQDESMEVKEPEPEPEPEAVTSGFDDTPLTEDMGIDHPYVGGNVAPDGAEEAGARFEEGIPLMWNDEENDEATNGTQLTHDTKDPFGEDAADDFFNNVGPVDHLEPAEPTSPSQPPALERKSTMQVLEAMNVGPLTRQDSDLAVLPEEPEEAPAQNGSANSEHKEDKEAETHEPKNESHADLAAQWAAALADDDDDELLLDDAVPETQTKVTDPAAFFGDDDEGFLDDVEDESSAAQPAAQSAAQPTTNRYVPAAAQTARTPQQKPANPYLPSATFPAAPSAVPSPYTAPGPAPSQFPINYGTNAGMSAQKPSQQSTAPKAQSFADKSKGGYHSPYDLPMDVVKPRKRPSMQHLPKPPEPVSAPPQGPSLARSNSVPPPPSASPAAAAAPHPHSSQTGHQSFFEDLPMIAKPRPASRHSQPSPVQANPYGPPQPPPVQPPSVPTAHAYAPPPPPVQSHYAPAPAPSQNHPPEAASNGPDIGKLVAPPRVNPYALLQSNLAPQSAAPHAPSTSRYSPSPSQTLHANGIPPSSRYSPAPSARAPSGGYAPATPGVTPPMLPHMPRTSSPLAHFEMSYDKQRTATLGNHLQERRSSSSTFESRLNRVPSLPPTREVLEEDDVQPRSTSALGHYSPQKARHTPPPQGNAYGMSAHTLSPPKRALSYTPQSDAGNGSNAAHFHAPPPSSTLHTSTVASKPADSPAQPPPVQDTQVQSPPARPTSSSVSRPRAPSQNFNLVPPTDGTEQDPLQRWKGAPIFAWGVGGTFVSSFPQDIPRYGINQALPMIHREAGEVHVKSIKEIQPLEERLAKFPGPLKGKSKKKEVVAWLTAGIEGLEHSLPASTFPLQVSHENKRLEERILLWKMLRIFIEQDGVLEGVPAVDKAVRDCLSPYIANTPTTEEALAFSAGVGITSLPDGTGTGQIFSEAVDSAVVEQIRKNLLLGDKEKAAWDAVDKRLWGHAFLISGAASPDLFKKVAQEFVRKEVNTPGLNNESLAALYDVLSGNHEECVDELVPVHCRAGLQLMTTQPTGTSTSTERKDTLAGLDKWQETLSLILSNRSPDDVKAINALGNLLSGYGRAEAAHVCYLFSRATTVFGGLDDPAANFVLVGADHRRQADSFAKETDAVLLSEVYEYGLSLTGSTASASGSPHLAAYKLQHAMTLAEYGFRDKALQYCETILSAMTVQTRRSPYYHAQLEAAADDLMKRLKQAPKEESNSWIPKPSMNKVSDTMWNRFNKFVAGDENEGAGPGSEGEAGTESGPFARLACGTPTISRPASSAGATGMDMFGSGQNLQMSPDYIQPNGTPAAVPTIAPPPLTRTSSRYAPASVSQPAAAATPAAANPYEPVGRRSLEQPGSRRQSSEYSPAYNNSYVPNGGPVPSPGRSESNRGGLSCKSSYVPISQAESTATPQTPQYSTPLQSLPYTPAQDAQTYQSPYTPATGATTASTSALTSAPTSAPTTSEQSEADKSGSAPEASGYQPPSYGGYEPPSFGTATSDATHTDTNGYEPPSFQPYSYEPPSYETGADADKERSDDDEPRPKKKSFMDDDDDDIPALKKPTKTKEEVDRENAELFRKAAEEDAKRAEEEKAAKAKKGWGLTSWFGGKKETAEPGPKAVRANLGEKSSFYFDPELKRWVNKNASPDDQVTAATPLPPPPRSSASTPAPAPPPAGGAGSPMGMAPPPRLRSLGPSPSVPNLAAAAAAAAAGGPPVRPPMMRSASGIVMAPKPLSQPPSRPPSRPATGISEANSIDDLLGAPGPRKAGARKGRKSGRYVDVMAK